MNEHTRRALSAVLAAASEADNSVKRVLECLELGQTGHAKLHARAAKERLTECFAALYRETARRIEADREALGPPVAPWSDPIAAFDEPLGWDLTHAAPGYDSPEDYALADEPTRPRIDLVRTTPAVEAPTDRDAVKRHDSTPPPKRGKP